MRFQPANRAQVPWFSYGLIGFAFLCTPFGMSFLSLGVQGLLAYTLLSWLSNTLRNLVAPARMASGHSSLVAEPKTMAEYKQWLFSNTHEPILQNRPIEYYRELYVKHKDKARRSGSGAAAAATSRSHYVGRGGSVTRAQPPPPLLPGHIALIIVSSCSLGALTILAGSAFVPYVVLPNAWIFHLPRSRLVEGLFAATNLVLATAHQWLPRAVGASVAALSVSLAFRASHAHDGEVILHVLTWSSAASIAAQLHAANLWFQVVAPAALRLLGAAGELLVFSPLTIPCLRLLLPAAAAAFGVGRAVRWPLSAAPPREGTAAESLGGAQHGRESGEDPIGSAARGATAHTTVRRVHSGRGKHTRLWPLIALAAAHLMLSGAYVGQSAQRVQEARQIGSLFAAGDVRSALSQLASSLGSRMRPPPPPPPMGGAGMDETYARERGACDVLGVRVGSAWADVKAAYRKLALANHPDKLQGQLERAPTREEEVEAAKQFQQIQEAHDALAELYLQRGDKE